MKEGTYLITPQERASFEKNCEHLSIEIIEISAIDARFDQVKYKYEYASDLIRLGTFMALDKMQ